MDNRAVESSDRSYIFGPYKLFPNRQLLLRDDVPVRIGTRAIEILTLLVRHAGELVAKEDLTNYVWPDTFVHEGNLKVNMAALRRVLAGAPLGASYIATVPGRGYRFVMPVQIEQSSTAMLSSDRSDFASSLPGLQPVIGRDDEIARLAGELLELRCVTIVGPGGSGKTTVAIAVAHRIEERYDHGVCFVDLSTIDDPQYLPTAIASALGVRLHVSDVLSGVLNVLRHRSLLLMLDNCEHLAAAVANAINLIQAAAPAVSVLATSREPLRAGGEHVHRLPTLAVPPAGAVLSAETALKYSAIELFVTRAAERGGYVFADADVSPIAAICRRLDGIALAIELAAGKMVDTDPATLLTMLEQRFAVLSHGPRSAPLRQQTMQATLDWSYKLLSEDEAKLLRFLCAFVGYFRLDDAVAMFEEASLEPSLAIDALGQLVAKSLVTAEYNRGAVRYRLLESTRAYAAERLGADGEERQALHRYSVLVLSLFEQAEKEWFWRVKRDWMSDYAVRIDDLRKAISWSFGLKGDRTLGIRLTAAAIPLWDELSSMYEARSRVDYALAAIQSADGLPSDVKMKLATAHAWGMTFAQYLAPETEAAWLDCVRFASEVGSTEYRLRGLWGLAVYLMYTGRHHGAIDQLERFKALAGAETGGSATPDGERLLANAEIYVGRLSGALCRLEALAAHYDTLEERSRIARFQVDRYVAIRGTLSFVLWLTGAPERAARMSQDAVDGAQSIGHIASYSTALALWVLPVAFWSGDHDRAAAYQTKLDDNSRLENIAIWGPVSRFFRGAISFAQGDPLGINGMREGLRELLAGRFVGRTPMYRAMLAEALLSVGEITEGRAHLDEAHAAAVIQGEKWCLAEILRVRSLFEMRDGNRVAADHTLAEAIREAQQIGALTLELRAALTLAGKWDGEGRGEEAAHMLSTILARSGDVSGSADLDAANRYVTMHAQSENFVETEETRRFRPERR